VGYLLYDDPATSAAPIEEPAFDTSNNVDAQTATIVRSLPPEEQAEYQQDLASSAGGNTTTGNSTQSGNATAPASTGPSLVQVCLALYFYSWLLMVSALRWVGLKRLLHSARRTYLFSIIATRMHRC
jgi:hypothetical protein